MSLLDQLPQLETIVLALKPRAARLHDPTPETCPNWSKEELAEDIEYINCVRYRVGDAIFGGDPSGHRGTTVCPACRVADALTLELPEKQMFIVQGHCSNGCSSKAIGDAIARSVQEYEEQVLRDELQNLMVEASTTPIAVEWLIPGLVPAHASTLLVGKSGDGKDWIAETFAICVAAGIPCFGRPVKRGPVLLVLLESKAINHGRLEPLARGLGVTLDDKFRREWLHVYPYPLKTDDPLSMAELARWVRTFRYSMIVIDNASEIRSSRSQSAENDSTIIGAAMRPLAQLAQDGKIDGQQITDNPPAIVTLHHAGNDGTSRGSTGFLQHADYVLEIRRKNQRDPESPIAIENGEGCRLSTDDLPITICLRGMMPAAVTPEIVQRATKQDADDKSDDQDADELRMIELLRKAPLGATRLRSEMGGSPNRITRLRDRLVDEGRIKLTDGLYRVATE